MSNDPIVVADLFIDLMGQLDPDDVPDASISGDGTALRMPIEISNTESIEANGTVDIQLITTTDGDPNNPDNIVVANLHDQALKPAPGGSKTFNAIYELPTGLDTNDYFLMTVVTSDAITEKDVINNSFVTTDAVSVGKGVIDMMDQFGETTLPSAVIAGEASTGKVSVTITNDGNLDVSNTAAISFFASSNDDIDNQNKVPRSTLDNQAVKLKLGAIKQYNANITLPATLATGAYAIIGKVELDGVEEYEEDNNVIVNTEIVVVAAPFVDVSGEIDETDLPQIILSSDGTDFKAPVEVANDGNTPDTGTVKGWMCVLRSETGSEVRGQRSEVIKGDKDHCHRPQSMVHNPQPIVTPRDKASRKFRTRPDW